MAKLSLQPALDRSRFDSAGNCVRGIKELAQQNGLSEVEVWEAEERKLVEKARVEKVHAPYRWVGFVVYGLVAAGTLFLIYKSAKDLPSAEGVAPLVFMVVVIICLVAVIWPFLIRGIGRFLRGMLTILITILLAFVALDNKRFEENIENYWTAIYLLVMAVVLTGVHSLLEFLWIRAELETEENKRRLELLHAALVLLQATDGVGKSALPNDPYQEALRSGAANGELVSVDGRIAETEAAGQPGTAEAEPPQLRTGEPKPPQPNSDEPKP